MIVKWKTHQRSIRHTSRMRPDRGRRWAAAAPRFQRRSRPQRSKKTGCRIFFDPVCPRYFFKVLAACDEMTRSSVARTWNLGGGLRLACRELQDDLPGFFRMVTAQGVYPALEFGAVDGFKHQLNIFGFKVRRRDN